MPKRVVVYGGNGALGSACVSAFKSKHFWVASVDMSDNAEADLSVSLAGVCDSLEDQCGTAMTAVQSALDGQMVDAVLCVAGGWAGGSVTAKSMLASSDLMWKQSVWSSLVAARLASSLLTPGGLLLLTGAKPALEPTPGMLGYGMAKAAVHQLTRSLAAGAAKAGSLASGHVLAILPVTMDTANNRKFMPDADKSTWTSLSYVTDLLYQWTMDASSRPDSGSLVQLITEGGVTKQLTAPSSVCV